MDEWVWGLLSCVSLIDLRNVGTSWHVLHSPQRRARGVLLVQEDVSWSSFMAWQGCRERGTKQNTSDSTHILYDMIYHFSLSKITAFGFVSVVLTYFCMRGKRGKVDKDRQIRRLG